MRRKGENVIRKREDTGGGQKSVDFIDWVRSVPWNQPRGADIHRPYVVVLCSGSGWCLTV